MRRADIGWKPAWHSGQHGADTVVKLAAKRHSGTAQGGSGVSSPCIFFDAVADGGDDMDFRVAASQDIEQDDAACGN